MEIYHSQTLLQSTGYPYDICDPWYKHSDHCSCFDFSYPWTGDLCDHDHHDRTCNTKPGCDGTGTALLTLAELSLLAFVLCFACTSGFSQDGLLIGCFILLLSLMLSGKSLTARIQLQPLIWLGTLSLPIYCIHEAVIISFWGYEIEKRNMFLIIFVAALILHLVVKLGKPLFGALGRGLKKLCCYPEQDA